MVEMLVGKHSGFGLCQVVFILDEWHPDSSSMVDTGLKFLSIFSSNIQKEAKWVYFSINLKSFFKRNKSQAAAVFLWEQFVNMHDLCHVWGRLWCSWSQQLFSGRRWRGRGGAGGGKSNLQGNRGARIIWACRRRQGGIEGCKKKGWLWMGWWKRLSVRYEETVEEESVDTQQERAHSSKTQGQTISCKSFSATI